MPLDEKELVRLRRGAGVPLDKVALDLAGKRGMKWDPPRAAFGFGDEQRARAEVDVLEPKAKGFTEADASAIEDENQHPIEVPSKHRAREAPCPAEQFPNLSNGKDGGNESRPLRQPRPMGLADEPTWVSSTKILAQLASNCDVVEKADRSSMLRS